MYIIAPWYKVLTDLEGFAVFSVVTSATQRLLNEMLGHYVAYEIGCTDYSYIWVPYVVRQ